MRIICFKVTEIMQQQAIYVPCYNANSANSANIWSLEKRKYTDFQFLDVDKASTVQKCVNIF